MKRTSFHHQDRIPDIINADCRNFTAVDFDLLRNPEISSKAKIILALTLGNIDGWVSSKSGLKAFLKEGTAAIDSALKELEDGKYLFRIQYCDPKTKQKRGSTWAATAHPYNFKWRVIFREIRKRNMEIWSGSLRKIKQLIEEKPEPGFLDMANLDIENLDIENRPLIILKNNKIKDNQIKKDSSGSQLSPDRIHLLWNEMAKNSGLSQILKLSSSRRNKIISRIEDLSKLSDWKKLFKKTLASSFLLGDNDRGWRADFDWLISNDKNYLKVLEGKYDSVKPKKKIIGRAPGDDNKYAGIEIEINTDGDF